jgi:hypothetical protein
VGSRAIAHDPDADMVAVKALSEVVLTIDEHGRFSLKERGLPKSGVDKPRSDGAELEITEIMRQPMQRQAPDVQAEYGPITLKVQGDAGEIVSLQYIDSKRPEPLVLKRRR